VSVRQGALIQSTFCISSIHRYLTPGRNLALACLLLTHQVIGASHAPRNGSPIRVAADFPGADVGDQINAAYADLPEQGGQITLTAGGSFSKPIVFGTNNKPVLLIGVPGDVVNLIYTGTTGTAITFDYGTGHRMGHGLRDVTLTGPGDGTDTVGVRFGGSNGAEGITFRDFKIQSFGRNLEMGSHTWLAYFEHGLIRNGGVNVLLPVGLAQAGEQIVFNHVTFADAPPPHQNSIWIQGGGQEVIFRDCSFDQAQLRIGDGGQAAAQVVVSGSHFENPNYMLAGSVNYDYVTVDNHSGNLLRITDSYFLQDAPSNGPSRFLMVNGGTVFLCGVGMYTPAGSPMQHFATLAKTATIDAYGFSDLSGYITGSPFGY
jgi:hypothetical protein